jgi:hypothetical protein
MRSSPWRRLAYSYVRRLQIRGILEAEHCFNSEMSLTARALDLIGREFDRLPAPIVHPESPPSDPPREIAARAAALRRLLLWADTTSHYALSLQRPEWYVQVDDDKKTAVATRKRILDMVATERLWAIGYHMPFPAVGAVEKTQDGYRWLPLTYQLTL